MSTTYNPDNLLAGDYPAVTDVRTIKSGSTLIRGAVLAKDSNDGDKLVLVDSASGTTSVQNPVCILLEDADASGGDVQAHVYLSGAFNQHELTFGGTDTADTHRDALRDLNIYLKASVAN